MLSVAEASIHSKNRVLRGGFRELTLRHPPSPVGGTGVYNTYRFGEDFSIQASMHGNMMKTRDMTGVSGSPFSEFRVDSLGFGVGGVESR